MERDQAEELTYLTAAEEATMGWRDAKIYYILAGVVLPTVWLVAAGAGLLSILAPPGRLCDYVGILLEFGPSGPFYPFLIYCMASMLCTALWPEKFSSWFLVRFGIYTGVILASQYFVLVGILTLNIFGIFWAIFGFICIKAFV